MCAFVTELSRFYIDKELFYTNKRDKKTKISKQMQTTNSVNVAIKPIAFDFTHSILRFHS